MPLAFQQVSLRDLARGIDARSVQSVIPEGFSEDLVNADTNSNGHLSKRHGYQGAYGRLPIRVSSIRHDGTNIVDANTGEVKVTLQVSAIDEDTGQITFKSAGLTRSTVLTKTVETEIPDTVAADDYVCLVTGTAVPELPAAYVDYLIQYAVVEIRRRLGENTQEEFAQLKELELEIQKMWVGREASNRVRKASHQWSRTLGGTLRRFLS